MGATEEKISMRKLLEKSTPATIAIAAFRPSQGDRAEPKLKDPETVNLVVAMMVTEDAGHPLPVIEKSF